MASLADHLSTGLVIVDPELTVLAWNRWMTEHARLAPEEAIGRSLESLFPDLPVATLQRRVKAALQLRSPSYVHPRRGYLFPVPLDRITESNFVHMQQRIRILPYQDEEHRAIIVIDDVTATREAEARAATAARASERYLELLDSNVMTLAVNANADDGRVIRASSALLESTGWGATAIAGQSLQALGLGPLDALTEAADGTLPERPLRRADGEALWVRVRQARGLIEDEVGAERHLVIQDISLQKKIQTLSERDTLTGAYNRMKFDQLLQAAISAHARYGQRFSIALCDIDHFKRVNDEHGHLAGDAVLRQFAALLQAQTRASDALARWGGEEFVLLLPMTSVQAATTAAEKLRRAIVNDHWPVIDQLSASFGVAARTPGESADALLDRADHALYQAKESGRNRVCTAEGPDA
ncbi:diguanylate cyclase [Lamprobacter modestohalophilus]|uniref:sensor domain-containing diguanylate cyclase n=1 Tax=Lamprobacter modestohalophilus TaxID=1064514 RepID=UPI002ADEC758|nr:diguanylate cyclase [Lamprobacter modestohalophilus]MEA1049396.1 diguanylate cyclase [Lamprobacter modestohalophilus]